MKIFDFQLMCSKYSQSIKLKSNVTHVFKNHAFCGKKINLK
jgi:hypothetical protein